MSEESAKTLIIGPAWVGDMVMAQTLFKLLKSCNPSVKLEVLAPAWSHPILQRMPEVDAAHASPFQHGQLQLRERFQLAKQFRRQKYTQAIVMRNSFKSALVPYLAKIPIRTGWLGEFRYGLLNDIRHVDKKKYPLMIQRFLLLADQVVHSADLIKYWPHLAIIPSDVEKTLQSLAMVRPSQPVLGLCPGAEFGPAKRWPAQYYAEVANYYLNKDWQVWLLGSVKDQPVTNEINKLSRSRCLDLAGLTQLTQAIDLLSLTQVVVTNDSGLMHISAALKKPVVVVYGSSSPQFTPPLSHKVEMLSLNIACSPCFKRECPLEHLKCLNDLKPLQVKKAVERVLVTAQ